VLLHARISDYYSNEYDKLKSGIIALGQHYNELYAQIGEKEIINHEMIEGGVFVTTYANGVRVCVNYNLYEAAGMDPMAYEIY
jgi:hypothetical protein